MTLLELLLALVLIALAATLAIPAFFARPEVTLDRAARLLARDLELAQHEAVRSGRDVVFTLREDGTGWSQSYADGSPVPSPGNSLDRLLTRDAVFEGVRVHRVQLRGDPRSIRFDRLGFAYGAGTIELRYEDVDCLVLIDEVSGFVTLRGLSRPVGP